MILCGLGSVVGIATRLQAGRSRDRIPVGARFFCTCPDQPWGSPSLLYNGYRVFPGGKEQPGRDADPSPPSSAVGHERVELYLYSPYGPYGLYRASVPVQGCTLPYLYYRSLSSLLCNFLHSPVTSYLLGPNILLSTLFSNNFTLRSFLNVSDQVSHPYKTTAKL